MALAGKFKGGYGGKTGSKPRDQGFRGYGTMKFATKGGKHDQKDMVGVGERPIIGGQFSRVLKPNTGKKVGRGGVAEGK